MRGPVQPGWRRLGRAPVSGRHALAGAGRHAGPAAGPHLARHLAAGGGSPAAGAPGARGGVVEGGRDLAADRPAGGPDAARQGHAPPRGARALAREHAGRPGERSAARRGATPENPGEDPAHSRRCGGVHQARRRRLVRVPACRRRHAGGVGGAPPAVLVRQHLGRRGRAAPARARGTGRGRRRGGIGRCGGSGLLRQGEWRGHERQQRQRKHQGAD